MKKIFYLQFLIQFYSIKEQLKDTIFKNSLFFCHKQECTYVPVCERYYNTAWDSESAMVAVLQYRLGLYGSFAKSCCLIFSSSTYLYL
jgi:hypothetical protein